MWFLLLIFLIGGFVYHKNTSKLMTVEKIEICGKDKVVINGKCVCDKNSGYYPIIGAFGGADNNICNLCDTGSVKVIDGVEVCDPEGFGGQRALKKKPTPVTETEQCGDDIV